MSQISKLSFVDGKLGAPTSGQQTTRILFNTIVNPPANTSGLVFFKNFQGLTNGQTNLNQNKLDSMESMVIKSISLMQFNANGVCREFGGNTQQTVSIIVGNQTVVKNLPIQFNSGSTGQPFDRLHENAGARTDNTVDITLFPDGLIQLVQPREIRLLTDIVIPPQVAFEVRVDSTLSPYDATGSLVCVLSGYGKIFSAGSSF